MRGRHRLTEELQFNSRLKVTESEQNTDKRTQWEERGALTEERQSHRHWCSLLHNIHHNPVLYIKHRLFSLYPHIRHPIYKTFLSISSIDDKILNTKESIIDWNCEEKERNAKEIKHDFWDEMLDTYYWRAERNRLWFSRLTRERVILYSHIKYSVEWTKWSLNPKFWLRIKCSSFLSAFVKPLCFCAYIIFLYINGVYIKSIFSFSTLFSVSSLLFFPYLRIHQIPIVIEICFWQ